MSSSTNWPKHRKGNCSNGNSSSNGSRGAKTDNVAWLSGPGLLRGVASEYELRKRLLLRLAAATGLADNAMAGAVVSLVVATHRDKGGDDALLMVEFQEGSRVMSALSAAGNKSSSSRKKGCSSWTLLWQDRENLSPSARTALELSSSMKDKLVAVSDADFASHPGSFVLVRYLEDWLDEDGHVEILAAGGDAANDGQVSDAEDDVLDDTIPTPWPGREDPEKSIIEQASWLAD